MDVAIVPYSRETVDDAVLGWFWNEMEKDGLHKTVFYSGYVKSAYDFVAFIKTQAVAVFVVDKDSKVPMAMGWLTDPGDMRAFAHFCVLKEHWDKSEQCGKMGLDYWLNKLGLNIVLGMIPTRNKHAISFVERIGMKIVGEIPMIAPIDGVYEPAILCYATKEEL